MDLLVGRKFRIGSKIGYGNNGEIYSGINIHTGEEVAIKLEPIRGRSCHLANESKVYRLLGKQGKNAAQ